MDTQAVRVLSPPTLEVLVKFDPFKRLHNRDVVRIARTFRHKKYRAGSMISTQDTSVNSLGFIQSGKVRLQVRVPEGGVVECGILGPGDFFGATAVLTDGMSSADLECGESTDCYIQSPRDFHSMIEAYPALRDFFMQIALIRLKKTYQVIRNRNIAEHSASSTSHSPRKQLRVIRKALDYIDRNFTMQLTLDEVADANGMSKYHFSRVFNEKTGVSFKEYLNRLRIKESKRLMRDEEFNVSEACYAVGFNDLSYFSRVFSKVEGLKPSEYRRQLDVDYPINLFGED